MATEPDGVAMHFGDPDQPVFGWWHAPAEPPLDIAVLLCPSYGREEVSGHRTLRHLARRLAGAGMPVLRFDYLGTGDSAGDECQGDQVGGWLRSIHAALDELRERSGHSRIAVVGLRLGALLGAHAAAQRSDVTAFASLAAVGSGRAFVREQKALQMASAARGVATSAEDLLESGGYAMNADTRDALSGLDLRQLSRAPAPQWLSIERDDMPPASPWVDPLRGYGCAVEQRILPGYAAAMQDPHNTQVPDAMIDAVVQWLSTGAMRAAGTPVVPRQVAAVRIAGVLEQPVSVDAGGIRLAGIMSSPEGAPPREAVLLINAGAQRRIGPSRLYVSLARRWARQGVLVLRLDLSGLGDSPARPGAADNVVYSASAVDEVVAAVQWLVQRQVSRCSVVGLCSGAYHGLKAAVRGAPLASVVAINPLTFFWHEGTPLDAPMPAHHVAAEMARYRANLFARERWLKLLKGQVNLRRIGALLWRRVLQVLAGPAREIARLLHLPMHEDLANELRHVSRAGVAMHFVFSAGDPGEELLRTQGGTMVRRLLASGTLTIDKVADADHTFTGANARCRVSALLTGLLFAPERPGMSAAPADVLLPER